MLRVDLGALSDGGIDIDRQVPADDSRFEGLDFKLGGPVTIAGRLSEAGNGEYYLHGTIEAQVETTCRRCIEPVTVRARSEINALFTAEDETGDPSVYLLPALAGEIELGELVREELILAVPAFVSCREDCRGLCSQCGANLNSDPCDCRPVTDSRWAALEQLKQSMTDG